MRWKAGSMVSQHSPRASFSVIFPHTPAARATTPNCNIPTSSTGGAHAEICDGGGSTKGSERGARRGLSI
eukprot:357545-Pyramimonas_sp.AAC.1